MPPQFPSIQSFFSSSSPPKSYPSRVSGPSPRHPSSSSLTDPGDGFSADEIEAVLHPPLHQWTPTQEYEEANIGTLEPGPRPITFMGRVVNFFNMSQSSKRPLNAKGCLKVMVADDTGAMTIRLWYANMDYKLHLGQLLTVWTVHISHAEHNSLAPSAAPLFTSIFPERERSCYIMVHENSDDGTICKRPHNCKDTQTLPGLITVKNFTNGGYDIDDCKLLVCVRSIGAKKKFTNKSGTTSELISIGVFDDTAEATITLYGAVSSSASRWQPSHTVLLITSPGWRIDRIAKLSLNANTRVDVDPDTKDAAWLRSFAQRMTKKEHINPTFPGGGKSFPLSVMVLATALRAAETASVRILYTLADIDEFARANPREKFTGFISVLITELNIVTYYRRNMLMCTECCGIPLYANSVTGKCKQCERSVGLRVNPRILGPIIDETGQITSGKLVFSDLAWEQLLGRTADQLVGTDVEVLKYLEQRMLFLRVSLGFGWCVEVGDVGRLCIWGVKM
ncbi:uncharacterized protein BDR25DRAFT_336616 [Lindgomyces ingoldianus]|uniref:Uncharacterized protein n=1 Tax=Lindgomyces ingoldianus TaxID=673940 RepID=A0ACB6QHJ6_9PLEO|nr:uncharacterized protein BDR25DRAFT_336616 [Lindgomyces ingoldianus]KAF2466043.1 hypothetical protein BDR25DRAFT_336616 [Lindgomyces ingoldianus]